MLENIVGFDDCPIFESGKKHAPSIAAKEYNASGTKTDVLHAVRCLHLSSHPLRGCPHGNLHPHDGR